MSKEKMELTESISSWIKSQVEQAGAQGVVVGLSGGIDSAVVAALAKKAIGDNVLGLIIPCHSQKQDSEDAHLIASHLSLQEVTLDISPIYDALMALLPPAEKKVTSNLKPRLRMTILYYFANAKNYLVAGTSNKSEISVGYFTKYGDGAADILPLGDLLKSEVRELARQLKIPDAIIIKTPSAGLWPGQTDEGELNLTYEQLDQALTAILSSRPCHIQPAIFSRVQELMAKSMHKRQPVPVFRVDYNNSC